MLFQRSNICIYLYEYKDTILDGIYFIVSIGLLFKSFLRKGMKCRFIQLWKCQIALEETYNSQELLNTDDDSETICGGTFSVILWPPIFFPSVACKDSFVCGISWNKVHWYNNFW